MTQCLGLPFSTGTWSRALAVPAWLLIASRSPARSAVRAGSLPRPSLGVTVTVARTGAALFVGYFSLLTVTSSWNWRFELGSSTLPTTMGLPT